MWIVLVRLFFKFQSTIFNFIILRLGLINQMHKVLKKLLLMKLYKNQNFLFNLFVITTDY